MERSGTEGSPVAIKKSSERDWVQGTGDPSAAVGMTSGWSGAKPVVANGSTTQRSRRISPIKAQRPFPQKTKSTRDPSAAG
ncbi:hypothetical protein [Ravibacter arvi]|uniref:hypothetical protein n=1 Tax=Ravibacter arvi TaxID=2051041 RepID=UPI0031EB57B2